MGRNLVVFDCVPGFRLLDRHHRHRFFYNLVRDYFGFYFECGCFMLGFYFGITGIVSSPFAWQVFLLNLLNRDHRHRSFVASTIIHFFCLFILVILFFFTALEIILLFSSNIKTVTLFLTI